MVQPHKYRDSITGAKFTSINEAARHAGIPVKDFKAYFGSRGFPYKRIITPHAGGGMGLFGAPPRAPAPRRRRLTR